MGELAAQGEVGDAIHDEQRHAEVHRRLRRRGVGHAALEERPGLGQGPVLAHLLARGEHVGRGATLRGRLDLDGIRAHVRQHLHHAVRCDHSAPGRVARTVGVERGLQPRHVDAPLPFPLKVDLGVHTLGERREVASHIVGARDADERERGVGLVRRVHHCEERRRVVALVGQPVHGDHVRQLERKLPDRWLLEDLPYAQTHTPPLCLGHQP